MRRLILLMVVATPIAIWGCAATNSPAGRPAAYHHQMGLSHLGERNYTAALQELLEAEKLTPDVADLQYSLGQAYMGKRRPDLAEQKFLKAISLKPDYSSAKNDLGVVYLDMKRWDNAIQQFKTVKDDLLYEQHDNALINLGLAYLGKGDYASAMQELNAVRLNDPRNPVVRVAIGRVLAAQDKTAQAISEYRKALEFYPDYAAAHYHLGLALMKSDLPAARNSFRKVLKILPDSEIGRNAMEYLELLK